MKRGQITIELLLALTIGAFILLSGAQLIMVGLESSKVGERQNVGIGLAQEGQAAVEAVREEDWLKIYNLTKDSPYHPVRTDSGWDIQSDADEPVSGYTRSIVINNVQRDDSGSIVDSGGTDDPSTQKVAVTVSATKMRDIVLVEYISRWENEVFAQTNWSGGAGQDTWADAAKYWQDDSNIDISVAGQIKLKSTGATSWWSENYKYRQKITFDNSGQAEDLENFPFLVKLTSANFDFSKARSDGFDVRFVDTNNVTVLRLERERYDQSGEVAEFWVKVPKINASSDTDYIYMYYGYDDASDAEDPEGVWGSHYKMVQHLQESSKTEEDYNDHLDSTSNSNDGEAEMEVAHMDASGQINGADDFDGGNDYVKTLDSDSLDITGDLTVEAWIRTADSGGIIFSNMLEVNPYNGYSLRLEGGKSRFQCGGNLYSTGPINTGAWKYVAVTLSGTTATMYIDGSFNNSGAVSVPTANEVDQTIGASYAPSYFLDGLIDEVRISDTPRSADWIKAQHLSMTDAFSSLGTEEKVPFGLGTDGAIALSANFNINTGAKINGRSYPDGVAYRVGGISGKVIDLNKADSDTRGIVAGDEILLINLQGSADDFEDVGNYEFFTVASVSGKTITVKEDITKSYDGSGISYDIQKVVVQRVPNYTDVTIDTHEITAGAYDECTPHDGILGCNDVVYTGIVVFRAKGTVAVAETGGVDVSSKGFEAGKNYGIANSLITTDNFSKIGLGSGADATGAGGGIIWVAGKTVTASANAYQFLTNGGDGTAKGAGGGSIKIISKNLSLGGTGASDEAVVALGGSGTEAGGNGKIYLSYRILNSEDYVDGSESNEECDPDVSGSGRF